MARKIVKSSRAASADQAPMMSDTAAYFDAEFTDEELRELSCRIEAATGLGTLSVHFTLLDRASKDIEHTLGIYRIPQHWRYIHVCRQLGIEYKSVARNAPKIAIADFIAFAKRIYPEFKAPKNTMQRALLEQKVHTAWCDWVESNCERFGCRNESHGICWDKFEPRDYGAIVDEIASHNAARPKLYVVRN